MLSIETSLHVSIIICTSLAFVQVEQVVFVFLETGHRAITSLLTFPRREIAAGQV